MPNPTDPVHSRASTPGAPLVSVVTVVRNGRSLLADTIRSVRAQTWPRIEYIVIDGGSTDGTVDVIREHAAAIDRWVSEPDGGVSDAFNKGIRAATGDLVALLNAGDWYPPDALSAVVAARDPGRFAVYHGRLAFHHEDGAFALESTPDLTQIWRHMSLFHPGMVVEREVYRRVGLYATAFRYAMDAEFVHRALRAGVPFVYVPRVLCHMRLGGQSQRQYRASYAEFRDSVILHGGPRLRAWGRYGWLVCKRWLLGFRAGRWLKRLHDRARGQRWPMPAP